MFDEQRMSQVTRRIELAGERIVDVLGRVQSVLADATAIEVEEVVPAAATAHPSPSPAPVAAIAAPASTAAAAIAQPRHASRYHPSREAVRRTNAQLAACAAVALVAVVVVRQLRR